MKKSIKLTTLAMTALMAVSTTSTAMAAEKQSLATSTGHVALEQNEKPITPTDPNPPTHNLGPLSLDTVPNLDFGSNKITGSDMHLNLKADTGINNADIDHADVQVSDLRGTGAGWQVNVKYGTATGKDDDATSTATPTDEAWTATTDGKTTTLAGIKLNFGTPTWMQGTDYNVEKPVRDGQPTGAFNATVINDQDQAYGTAGTDEGMGTWLGSMAKSDISLDIPQKSAVKGDYTASLVWTLTDTPVV